MFNLLDKLIDDRIGEIEQNDRMVIGYLCSYLPEELIYASGAIPVRLVYRIDNESKTLGGEYLGSDCCPLAKSCVGLKALNSHPLFKNLDAIIFSHSCDAMRKALDIWRIYFDTPVCEFVVPRTISQSSLEFFHNEINLLKLQLENWTDREITTDNIRDAISLYNIIRRYLISIYDLRKMEIFSLNSFFISKLMKCYFLLGKQELANIFPSLIRDFSNIKKENLNGKVKFLLTGSPIMPGDTELFKLIEDCGATIAVEESCTGIRSFQNIINEEIDPTEALARGYLFKTPCARTRDLNSRLGFIKKLASEYKADGIICHNLKFCYSYGIEANLIKRSIKSSMPVLTIERDSSGSDIERTKTMIGAFTEMIKWKK